MKASRVAVKQAATLEELLKRMEALEAALKRLEKKLGAGTKKASKEADED